MVIIMSIFPSEVTETQKREVVAQYNIGFSNHGAARGKFQKGSLKKKTKKKTTHKSGQSGDTKEKDKTLQPFAVRCFGVQIKKTLFFSSQELKLQYY